MRPARESPSLETVGLPDSFCANCVSGRVWFLLTIFLSYPAIAGDTVTQLLAAVIDLSSFRDVVSLDAAEAAETISVGSRVCYLLHSEGRDDAVMFGRVVHDYGDDRFDICINSFSDGFVSNFRYIAGTDGLPVMGDIFFVLGAHHRLARLDSAAVEDCERPDWFEHYLSELQRARDPDARAHQLLASDLDRCQREGLYFAIGYLCDDVTIREALDAPTLCLGRGWRYEVARVSDMERQDNPG